MEGSLFRKLAAAALFAAPILTQAQLAGKSGYAPVDGLKMY